MNAEDMLVICKLCRPCEDSVTVKLASSILHSSSKC